MTRVWTICGGTECPTCGRWTEALIGPCHECCLSYERTGRFRRRVARPTESDDECP